MDEQQEELAALNALHALDESEQSALEISRTRDSELDDLASELELTVAELAALAPAIRPPAALKASIMAQVKERARVQKLVKSRPVSSSRMQPLAWGIAATLAAGCFWLWNERTQLAQQVAAMTEVEAEARQQLIRVRDERDALDEKNAKSVEQMVQLATQLEGMRESSQITQQQLVSLTKEISDLRKKDAFAQVQIASLQSTVAAYKEGVAVVVWDSEKHQGLLKLEKMPPVESGKDYQLWVVDPKNPTPVNAGVVQLDGQGFAKVEFKPVEEVSSAAKFALSVEREGGVAKNEGPIILIGP
ncbi:anti-sigma factor domain-containing protein [Prosthecobacter dejongeii]|uniref:Regulator of SigK n=1 Tax=Prosthecobacter dejongeii TaxID=48465 RepID=A0A7W8DS62_9BACT|nr:anti-sigma factor [Prosthecobacter dejongeii]MBB5040142.1 anti-sigma-K factor RskA [Prosthecobacter dejongeii]